MPHTKRRHAFRQVHEPKIEPAHASQDYGREPGGVPRSGCKLRPTGREGLGLIRWLRLLSGHDFLRDLDFSPLSHSTCLPNVGARDFNVKSTVPQLCELVPTYFISSYYVVPTKCTSTNVPYVRSTLDFFGFANPF